MHLTNYSFQEWFQYSVKNSVAYTERFYHRLPQGQIETSKRLVAMVNQMEEEGFGHCTNTEACQVECPEDISVLNIARMNYEYNKAKILNK